MKEKNIFNRILNNNKALAVVSVIVSAFIWLFVSVEKSPETTTVIKDIPISVNSESLRALGLESYGVSGFSASVTVRGKNYIVEDKGMPDKITVSADTGSVVTAGHYTLRLDVQKNDSRSDFEIISVEPSTISAFFDTPVTDREFIIEPIIESSGSIVPDGYTAGNAIIDSSSAKIKVSGPASEVNKIERLAAVVRLDEPITRNGSFETEFRPVTSGSDSLNYVTYDHERKVTVKVPVYKNMTLETAVDYVNRPSEYIDKVGFDVSVTPASVSVGVNSSATAELEKLIVRSIDFSELHEGKNTFNVTAQEVEKSLSCMILDGTEKFEITVNVENMERRTFEAPALIEYSSAQLAVNVGEVSPDFTQITVIGPKEALDSLSADDITLNADVSKIKAGQTGKISVPVTCVNNGAYWIYGSYTASVTVS